MCCDKGIKRSNCCNNTLVIPDNTLLLPDNTLVVPDNTLKGSTCLQFILPVHQFTQKKSHCLTNTVIKINYNINR